MMEYKIMQGEDIMISLVTKFFIINLELADVTKS